MTKRVLVPVADGIEEIEAVCIIDTLRRAGAEVTVAAVGERQITASRGVKIVADCLLADCESETYDLIALPGGMPGAEQLRDSDMLRRMLTSHVQQRRLYGAICAAPAVVLQHYGLLSGRCATCHPHFANHLDSPSGLQQRVVVDGLCVTSQGPGTALEFALALVEILFDKETAQTVADPMILP